MSRRTHQSRQLQKKTKTTGQSVPDFVLLREKPLKEVDIVTPVYGRPDFVAIMVDSLRSYDAGLSWNLTLVDDLGPDRLELDELYEQLKKEDGRIKVIRNARNSGFSASNNNGVRRGKSPLILLLNSDTKMCKAGWLRAMTEVFDDKTVGIVGAKLLFFEDSTHPNRPAGKVQHAGVAFNVIGQPYHVFVGWDSDHPKVSRLREHNAVTAACLMTRRGVYEAVGGLDPIYTTGNFEDVEYCLRVRHLGGKVIYQPESVLYHYAGGSGNSATAQINEQIFRLRCKDIIEYDEWRYW